MNQQEQTEEFIGCSNEQPFIDTYHETQGRTPKEADVNERVTTIYAWLLLAMVGLALISSL